MREEVLDTIGVDDNVERGFGVFVSQILVDWSISYVVDDLETKSV